MNRPRLTGWSGDEAMTLALLAFCFFGSGFVAGVAVAYRVLTGGWS